MNNLFNNIPTDLPEEVTETPQGETTTIDIRRLQLVRLDRQCAKAVWKKLRSKSTKKKNR